MKTVINMISVVVVVAGFVCLVADVGQAAVSQQTEACLNKIKDTAPAIEVPEDLLKLVENTRKINPHLSHIERFTQLLKDRKSITYEDLDIHTALACNKYLAQVLQIAVDAGCTDQSLMEINPYLASYRGLPERYPELDVVNGYVHACYFWEKERVRQAMRNSQEI